MFNNSSHSDIFANQPLAIFFFSSYLSLDTISTVFLTGGSAFFDPLKHTGCTIESIPSNDSVIIQAKDVCGDQTLRNFLASGKIDFSIIAIRPNPARDEVTIETEFAAPNEARIIIYDDLGKQWYDEQKTFDGRKNFTIAISSLPSGNYHIALKSPSGSVSSDFVKAH